MKIQILVTGNTSPAMPVSQRFEQGQTRVDTRLAVGELGLNRSPRTYEVAMEQQSSRTDHALNGVINRSFNGAGMGGLIAGAPNAC